MSDMTITLEDGMWICRADGRSARGKTPGVARTRWNTAGKARQAAAERAAVRAAEAEQQRLDALARVAEPRTPFPHRPLSLPLGLRANAMRALAVQPRTSSLNTQGGASA